LLRSEPADLWPVNIGLGVDTERDPHVCRLTVEFGAPPLAVSAPRRLLTP